MMFIRNEKLRYADTERTLVYLHFDGVDEADRPTLRRALEHVCSRLWGPASLMPLGGTQFALLLEGWSAARSLQLCGIFEEALQKSFAGPGREVRLGVGLASAVPGRPTGDLLARAREDCRAGPMGGRVNRWGDHSH